MWHPEPDRLALAALPADQEVVTHLAACPLCREHVEALRRTVELDRLGWSVIDDSPAPAARVWEAIADQLGAEDQQVGRHPTAVRWRWRAVAVPIVAAVIGSFAGLVLGAGLAPTPTGTPIARLAPLGGRDPDATGTVAALDRDGGHEMVVLLDGVTDLAGGDHLEAWLTDSDGAKLLPLGSLTQDGTRFRGSFAVPAGLPMAAFGTVDISAETWDGNPAHSRVSLLRGALS